MNFNCNLTRSYPKNGNMVFVYTINTDDAGKAEIKKLQGDFYRPDDKGNPLYFTTNCMGDRGKLVVTSKGKLVADMSEFHQAASLAKQFGGNLGNALASVAAAKLMGGSPTPEPQIATNHSNTDASHDNLDQA